MTEVANQGAGQQSHAGDGQQLQEPLPGEQVVQRRQLGQHDACLHTDEVVGQETNEDGAEEEGDGDVDDGGGHVEKPVRTHGKKPQEEQKEEQTVLVLLHLLLEHGDFIGEEVHDVALSKGL